MLFICHLQSIQINNLLYYNILLNELISWDDIHFHESCAGIKEVGCNPEHGPPFRIAATQFIHITHISVLCEIGLLKLFSLRTINVGQLVVYSGPISTTNSGSNGASIPDETEPLFLN